MKRCVVLFLYMIFSSVIIAFVNSLTGFTGQENRIANVINDVMWGLSGTIVFSILFFPFEMKKMNDVLRGQDYDLFLASLESEGKDEEET